MAPRATANTKKKKKKTGKLKKLAKERDKAKASTGCKASLASRNCTNSSGYNEGAFGTKDSGLRVEWVACRRQDSGFRRWLCGEARQGHCEERKTHFCTFIAQHLLCTDILLRPSHLLSFPHTHK